MFHQSKNNFKGKKKLIRDAQLERYHDTYMQFKSQYYKSENG